MGCCLATNAEEKACYVGAPPSASDSSNFPPSLLFEQSGDGGSGSALVCPVDLINPYAFFPPVSGSPRTSPLLPLSNRECFTKWIGDPDGNQHVTNVTPASHVTDLSDRVSFAPSSPPEYEYDLGTPDFLASPAGSSSPKQSVSSEMSCGPTPRSLEVDLPGNGRHDDEWRGFNPEKGENDNRVEEDNERGWITDEWLSHRHFPATGAAAAHPAQTSEMDSLDVKTPYEYVEKSARVQRLDLAKIQWTEPVDWHCGGILAPRNRGFDGGSHEYGHGSVLMDGNGGHADEDEEPILIIPHTPSLESSFVSSSEATPPRKTAAVRSRSQLEILADRHIYVPRLNLDDLHVPSDTGAAVADSTTDGGAKKKSETPDEDPFDPSTLVSEPQTSSKVHWNGISVYKRRFERMVGLPSVSGKPPRRRSRSWRR
eukprot:NODE_1335_length_1581_cov_17.513055_g1199_i0.p1 GENE.NODE_1335_length_1581_cov_17.513055_g1199_i0~~NODE_1335_length_1581_cov_17.513055_g1199_i0.p1  ORF type:complete len:427 (+),score=51.02 NODE_1335_length_1581_cov_17.513055_g1199_i0:197-1477(+)